MIQAAMQEEMPPQEAPVQQDPVPQEPMPQQAPPQGAPQQQGKIPPQIMKAFQKASLAAMKLLYSKPETAKGLVKMVADAPTPEEGVAHGTQLIIGQMQQLSKGSGQAVIERMEKPVAVWIAEMALVAKAVDEQQAKTLLPKVFSILDSAKAGTSQAPAPQQPAPQPAPQEEGLVASEMGV